MKTELETEIETRRFPLSFILSHTPLCGVFERGEGIWRAGLKPAPTVADRGLAIRELPLHEGNHPDISDPCGWIWIGRFMNRPYGGGVGTGAYPYSRLAPFFLYKAREMLYHIALYGRQGRLHYWWDRPPCLSKPGGIILIRDYYSSPKEPGSKNELDRFIEIFAREGWLNRKIKIKYQDKMYWISCNRERFFTYQINENSGMGPGVPGWPVYIISRDYVFDESKMANLSRGELNGHNWLSIIGNRNFEVIAHHDQAGR